ncbi:MAG: isoprenylcysteine carboxylmethyltransferase family protein [Terracidiphilus sp.]
MKASAIEFRLRMWIQIVILFLGFWAPWIGALDLSRRYATLAWLALELSRSGLVSFTVATPIVIVCGAVAALIGAVLRVWGVAYLGYGVVHHGDMQGRGVVAAGPYRYMRNPLYVGGWFMLLAICLLMPPSGALFSMVLLTVHFLRLILGEEAFLAAKLGEPYQEYLRAVPRFIPRLRSSLPPAPAKAHWLVALGTELNAIGIFFTLAVLSWTYDNLLMIKTVLVVFGASLVVRAAMPHGGTRAETA